MNNPNQVDVKTLEGEFSLTMGVVADDSGSDSGRIVCIKEEDCEEIVPIYDSNIEFDQSIFSPQMQPQRMMNKSPIAVKTLEGEFYLTRGFGGNFSGSDSGRIVCIKEEDCEEIVPNYDSNIEFDQSIFSPQKQPPRMMNKSPIAVKTLEGEFSLTMGFGGNVSGSDSGRIVCIKEEDCEEIVSNNDSNIEFEQSIFSLQKQPQRMMNKSPIAVKTLEGEFSLTRGFGGNFSGSDSGRIVCIKEEDCEEIVPNSESNIEFDQSLFSPQKEPPRMMNKSPIAVKTLEGEFSLTRGFGGNFSGSDSGRIVCIKEEDCEEIVSNNDSNIEFEQSIFSLQKQPQRMMNKSPIAVKTLEGEFSLTRGFGGNFSGSDSGRIVCIKEEDCEEIVPNSESNIEFDQSLFSPQKQPPRMMNKSPIAVKTLEGEFSLTRGFGGNFSGSDSGRIVCIKEEDCEEIVSNNDSNIEFEQSIFSLQKQPQRMMNKSPIAVKTLEGEFSLTRGFGGNFSGSDSGRIVCIKEEDCEEIVPNSESNIEFDQSLFSPQKEPPRMMNKSPIAVKTLEGEFSLTRGFGGNFSGSDSGRIVCIKEEDCEEIVSNNDSNIEFEQSIFSLQKQPQRMMNKSPIAVKTLEGEFSLTRGFGGNFSGSDSGRIVCIKEEDCEEIVSNNDSNIEFEQSIFSLQKQPQRMMNKSPIAVKTLEGEFSLTRGFGGNFSGSDSGRIVCIKEEDCEKIVPIYDSNIEFDQSIFSPQMQPQRMMNKSPIAVKTLEGEFSLTRGFGGNFSGSDSGRIVCIKEEDCEEIVPNYDSNIEFEQSIFSLQKQPQRMMNKSPIAVKTLEGEFSLTRGFGGNFSGSDSGRIVCIKEEDCEEIVPNSESNIEFDQSLFSPQKEPPRMMNKSPIAVKTLEGEFSLTRGFGGNFSGSDSGRIVCIKEEDFEEMGS